ncbi:MFS transporter [Streptomyces sp. NPDC018031]|uniref:MFS transporter n=1 Tax=Streptomyces sp. NPDC018031 TaxID=3365033 RepID=UPI0037A1D863
MPLALLALAIGAFGIGTTEFVIMGLLPEVANDFDVSIPLAGYATTLYALGVVLGAPLMTVLGTRLTRKQMLLLLMGVFIVGNALTAAAPAFGLLLAGRIVAAFAHGAFFGIGAIVAADLVAPEKRATAIATMFTGLTLSNVAGVPAGTWLGQQVSWRATFLAVAALGVIGLLGVARLVPAQPERAASRLGSELAVFRNPQVGLAMLMTILGFGGVFAAVTYLASMMTEVTGFAESSVTWLTAAFGVGLFGGNLISGRLADRSPMPMLYASLSGLAVSLGLFTFTAHHKVAAVVTLVLIGAFGFATVPPLQKRVMDQAAAAPTLASAGNIAAFNFGNALAAWLGGLVISGGLGYTAVNWVGALMTVSAILIALYATHLERRTARSGRVVAGGGTAAPASGSAVEAGAVTVR